MSAAQLNRIRVAAANKAHKTMDSYTGKDLAALKQSRHLAAVKAHATRRANAAKANRGKKAAKPAAKPALVGYLVKATPKKS